MTFKFPEKVHKVEVLNCNNNCSGCLIEKRKNLTTEDLKKMIAAGIGQNEIISFNRGELAIRNDFFELINFSRKQGFRLIWLETNGRIFYYPEFAAKIDKLGIDKFTVKFYSHKKDIHEKITQVPGSFSQTLGGIKNLLNSHKYVAIKLILNQDNCDGLSEIVEFLAGLKVREIDFWLSSDLTVEKIAPVVKAAENICSNYQIITRRLNWPFNDLAEIVLNQSEKEIADKIRYIWENNINYLDLKLRQEIFGNIELADILQYFAKYQQAIFHSSSRQFPVLLPRQGKASYSHGNFLAVYAQDDPWEAIFRAVIDRSGFFACKKIGSKHLFFAEKKIRDNLSGGYIHILPKQNFLYSCHEYFTFGNVVPLCIFQTVKEDFVGQLEPYPFRESERATVLGHFQLYERDLIREICLNQYKLYKFDKMHSFEHVYRSSELAFSFALKEAPEYANEIFIGACLHDIGRLDGKQKEYHGMIGVEIARDIINKFFKRYFNQEVLEAIKIHPQRVISDNPLIGCILDADRIDLLRQEIIPKEELLSTASAKKMLKNIIQYCDNNFDIIFENWKLHLDFFRKFLWQQKKSLAAKFFQELDRNEFKDFEDFLHENYAGLGDLIAVHKYTKHSCNNVHLFVFANIRVIVKFSDRSENQIEFENYLLELLKGTVNLPQIVKTKNKRLFIRWQDKKVVLIDYIQGGAVSYLFLENDVVNLLKKIYEKRVPIAQMYEKILLDEYQAKINKDIEKDSEFIENGIIKNLLLANIKLLKDAYNTNNFVPAFKGLQLVSNDNKNYFLGTEHLYELYLPLNQAIANYVVNIIFLADREYGIKDIKNLIKKFLLGLGIKNIYLNTKLILLFIYIQYAQFLKNIKLEDKSFEQKWHDLLLKINEIFELYQ